MYRLTALLVMISTVSTAGPIQYESPFEQVEVYHKINADERTNKLVEYAYEISDGDLDFIHTIECENGQRQPLRQSNYVKNGIRETSFGLCQRNTRWHSRIVNHENFADPYRQLDTCRDMFQAWKTNGQLPYRLYGYNKRNKCEQNFERTTRLGLKPIKELSPSFGDESI